MKRLSLLLIVAASLFSACSKPSAEEDRTGGLLNFTVIINEQEYKAVKIGPYDPDETVIVKVPSSYEDPTDLTALECYASFANNCYAEPVVPAVCDFSKPVKITVVNADGIPQTNTILVEYSYPKIHVEQVWEKNCTELGMKYHFQMNLACDEEYLYIIDNQQGEGKDIRVFDRKTGKFVKNLPQLPGLCFCDVHVDDAGNLLASTFNLYNAGFKLYTFNPGSEQWQEIIKYINRDPEGDDPGLVVPSNLGWKSSVVGDVYGNAYVYATIRGSWEYYEWEISNGVVSSSSPKKRTVAGVEPANTSSTLLVVRENATALSDTWISADGGNLSASGSYLKCISSDYDEIEVPADNFGHRAQNLAVFTMGEDKWMAVAGVGACWSYSGSHLSVFNITDKNNITMKPGDPNYSFDFRLFKCSGVNGQSTSRTCGLGVYVEKSGKEAYIYWSNSSKGLGDEKDLPDSIVRCYRVTYSE